MKTNNRSSSIADSCLSEERSFNGSGSRVSGRREERGGVEIRAARGAVVCGMRDTRGFHGAINVKQLILILDNCITRVRVTYTTPSSLSSVQELASQLLCYPPSKVDPTVFYPSPHLL